MVATTLVSVGGGRRWKGTPDDIVSVGSRVTASRVVTASKDGDARIWDARTGAESLFVLSGHFGTVFDASFSPDGTWVVTAGPAERASGTRDRRAFFLQGDAGALRAAAFASPTRIVTRGADGVRSYECDTCGDLERAGRTRRAADVPNGARAFC